jgi:hypothetical protein
MHIPLHKPGNTAPTADYVIAVTHAETREIRQKSSYHL